VARLDEPERIVLTKTPRHYDALEDKAARQKAESEMATHISAKRGLENQIALSQDPVELEGWSAALAQAEEGLARCEAILSAPPVDSVEQTWVFDVSEIA
jgi:hypothetical protein